MIIRDMSFRILFVLFFSYTSSLVSSGFYLQQAFLFPLIQLLLSNNEHLILLQEEISRLQKQIESKEHSLVLRRVEIGRQKREISRLLAHIETADKVYAKRIKRLEKDISELHHTIALNTSASIEESAYYKHQIDVRDAEIKRLKNMYSKLAEIDRCCECQKVIGQIEVTYVSR